MQTARYLNEKQLEKLTGRSIKSLQRDRLKGEGIPYIKFGAKVLYDMQDIEAWMNSRKYQSTSEYAEV